jgi:hypothetical protein
MVSVNLKGGLGNMMFQIAFIEDLARRGGFEVRYPDIDDTFKRLLKSGHSQNCYDYLKIFKNFDWQKNQDCPMPGRVCCLPNKYMEIIPVDNMIYDGYFQSEKYFNRDETLKLFEPSDFIKEKLPFRTMKGVTSIHIRRGDFLDPADVQFNLGLDYYSRAEDIILDFWRDGVSTFMMLKKILTFVIFSDDYKWCRDHFIRDNFSFFEDISKSDDYFEIFWMSMCEHNIIANSSFSWWGAYLNRNPGKVTVAPRTWLKSGVGMDDVYTSNMIIV